MRVLLLHPNDSLRRGPWASQRWDLVVDLAKSAQFSVDAWQEQMRCPVLRSESFRGGVEDVRAVRKVLSSGKDHLLDEEGIDWWELISLQLVPDALTLLPLSRLAAEIASFDELWATRTAWPVSALAILLDRSIRSFESSVLARPAARVRHYAGLSRRLSLAHIKEILLDKYDAGYQWRSRFATKPHRCTDPVVLVPSAYSNVSRMAAAYATMLPQLSFLMVATRQNARQLEPASNMQLRDLAAYAKPADSSAEVKSMIERWMELSADLSDLPGIRVLSRAGLLNPFPDWIRDGLSARDAWREVISREPVCGVLCGDDSNWYTRLPVLLASRRGIPGTDFHHGALDGVYLIKSLLCDVYLAKSQMERDYLVRVCGLPADKIVIAAPARGYIHSASRDEMPKATSAIFFSEPYEVAGMRAEEVYRELLPLLCRLARENNRGVILKLHPFESRTQRWRLLRDILTIDDRALVRIVDGPLTNDLMAQAWFGITVESTTVMDCLQNGVQCFLCGWLRLSPYGYVEQYARFGLGEVLQNAQQITTIPKRLEDFHNAPKTIQSVEADPAMLQRWLTFALASKGAVNPVS